MKKLKFLIGLVLQSSSLLFFYFDCNFAAAAVEIKEAPTIALSKPAATMDANAIQPKFRSRMKTDPIYVARLAFSPDSRYLAIGDEKSGTVIVRDLVNDREQARFNIDLHLRGPYMINWDPGEELIWSPDGRFLTNGVGTYLNGKEEKGAFPMTFWDPMTGAVSYRSNIFGSGKFNKDGSKLIVREIGSDLLFIYDTNTWSRRSIDTGLSLITLFNWTAQNEIMAVGMWHGPKANRTTPILADGKIPPSHTRLAIKLDSNQENAPQVLILSEFDSTNNTYFPETLSSHYLCHRLVSHFTTNRLALSCEPFITIIDPQSMKRIATSTAAAQSHVSGGERGLAFSADGNYLYLVGTNIRHYRPSEAATESMIIDTRTGNIAGSFPASRHRGIAISPDGKTLAVGNEFEIVFYDLLNQ